MPNPLRVYLDNDVASGRVFADLGSVEMAALCRIEQAHYDGIIKMVTSRESWREQSRHGDARKRAQLVAAQATVSIVPHDHDLLGFRNEVGLLGTTHVEPLVTDIIDQTLFNDLKRIGLKDGDGRHLMYAVGPRNRCDRFVTLDRHFHSRKSILEARCPSIRIVRPSELIEELAALG